MNECKRCNGTGTIRTTLLINERYCFNSFACACKNGSKHVDLYVAKKNEKELHDAIDRMTTKEVLQYIRDTISGKKWDGGMKEVKKVKFDLPEDCPF